MPGNACQSFFGRSWQGNVQNSVNFQKSIMTTLNVNLFFQNDTNFNKAIETTSRWCLGTVCSPLVLFVLYIVKYLQNKPINSAFLFSLARVFIKRKIEFSSMLECSNSYYLWIQNWKFISNLNKSFLSNRVVENR